MSYPLVIQGGMGVAISSWTLAKAVSQSGQLGVVSGTGIDTVMTRRLQLGDIGGHMRRAFDHFPIAEVAERVWERYFVPGGKDEDAPFKSKPVPMANASKALIELLVLSNFVEVFLAKEGHDGVVGVNLLEKIQLPTIPSLFGAMLAGVDYVIMGAGIPRAIPAILDRLSRGERAELDLNVAEEAPGAPPVKVGFDPAMFGITEVKRPKFLAVISSALLAQVLVRKCAVPPDGFVIEGPTAGGHNAPPRGEVQLSEIGEPVYTEKDVPDLVKIGEFGLPFWLAGSYSGRLRDALAQGAAGIQVGTAFAFCEESGMRPDIRAQVLADSIARRSKVYTDPKASPTGFPFKVVQTEQTLSDEKVYAGRTRICDLGYLREAYRQEDGKLGYRCPSEPIEDYVDKGGDLEDTYGRKCICNGLLATAGFAQVRKGVHEVPIVTAGDEVAHVAKYLKPGQTSYTAKDVLDFLLSS